MSSARCLPICGLRSDLTPDIAHRLQQTTLLCWFTRSGAELYNHAAAWSKLHWEPSRFRVPGNKPAGSAVNSLLYNLGDNALTLLSRQGEWIGACFLGGRFVTDFVAVEWLKYQQTSTGEGSDSVVWMETVPNVHIVSSSAYHGKKQVAQISMLLKWLLRLRP